MSQDERAFYLTEYGDFVHVADHLVGPESILHKFREVVITRSISRMIPDDTLCLDAGCGSGLIARHLRNVIGLDISRTELELAKKYAPHGEYVQADILSLPLRNCAVDSIICTEVLEHVSDASTVMEEFNRVLKSDGLLIGSVPLDCLIWKLSFLSRTRRKLPYHKLYTLRDLRLLLDGFFSVRARSLLTNIFFVGKKKVLDTSDKPPKSGAANPAVADLATDKAKD